MAKSLLVVESPTKMKTLSKFLGKDFVIKATFGHIKDLPKSQLGVDVEKKFAPEFVIVKGKSKVVDDIKKTGKEVDQVFIGSDPDREGEAIAFHVAEVLGPKKEVKRVLFHEITKNAVLEAFKSAANLDEAKYEAQKARRILDRLVGYRISPLLWEKVSYGLSAGRVQSVALRLVCEREEEIESFVKEEYWIIEVALELSSGQGFKAILERKGGKKFRVATGEQAEAVKRDVAGALFTIASIDIKDRHLMPQPAFITSRLQQEASRRLKFAPKKTMLLAQKLYEGVDVGEEGPTGLITYMRTDSVRVSMEAIGDARRYIGDQYGKSYLPKAPHFFRNRKSAQDAHEAIRPTYVRLSPDKVKPFLERDMFLLYELIWKRFVASQMAQERVQIKVVEVETGDYTFVARGRTILFDGFSKLYEEEGEDEEDRVTLPAMETGEKAALKETTLSQRFTSPPPRFTEATLIRMLETKGIGRPSTYATIVSTVQDRSYVKKERGRLAPTPLGRTVNSLLVQFFPVVMDVGFTAKMEERLDQIEDGKRDWVLSLDKFNLLLNKELNVAQAGMRSLKREERETEILCPKCGNKMLLKWSKNGEYLVCSGKPECKYRTNARVGEDGTIKVVEIEVKGICPKCQGNLIEKRGRFGRFLACANYPACKHTEPYSLGFLCPEDGCDGRLVEKVSKKKRRFVSCSRYPKCSFATNREPTEGPCPQCDAPTLFSQRGKTSCLRKGCGWKSKWSAEASQGRKPHIRWQNGELR